MKEGEGGGTSTVVLTFGKRVFTMMVRYTSAYTLMIKMLRTNTVMASCVAYFWNCRRRKEKQIRVLWVG